MSSIQRVELDSTLRCADAVEFDKRMRDRVVGQDEALDKISWKIQTFMAGLNAPGRPAGILLFLGPTGDSAFKTWE
jgi:ATP-dependent Clp protease ATP-binding subunit ClpA